MGLTFYEIGLIIASILSIIAVYYSFMLSKETEYEKYWLTLAVGFFIFAFHEWSDVITHLSYISENLQHIIEISSIIIGSLLIAYSTRGLYFSMKKVKEKTK